MADIIMSYDSSVMLVNRGSVDYCGIKGSVQQSRYFVARSKINMKNDLIRLYQNETSLRKEIIKDDIVGLSDQFQAVWLCSLLVKDHR